jgi:hypothetical protein
LLAAGELLLQLPFRSGVNAIRENETTSIGAR